LRPQAARRLAATPEERQKVFMRLALALEYDGAQFCGWQTQPTGCGIQDHLEAALARIAGHDVETVCAGRTDAGVHACEQIVHFDTCAHRPLSAWVRGTNAMLPPGSSVLWSREMTAQFHARYSALRRHYRYVLLNRPVRPAIGHGRVGWFHLPLDPARMREAAAFLAGEHDFSAFRSSECQARSPIRRLERISIARRGDYLIFDFRANAFLHHMVRNLVGTLVYVGSGRHEPQWVRHVLLSRDRALAAPTFDAAGLYLARVEYDAAWELPASTDTAAGVIEDLIQT
jgi:tRNA pseudouridine38-40 synthase